MANPFAESFTELFIGYDIYYVDNSNNLLGSQYKPVHRKESETGESVIYVYASDQTILRFDISDQIHPDESGFDNGTVPASIYLTNESVRWDFGDGSSDNGLIVHHTFNKPGEFVVSATARDYDGRPRPSKYFQKIIVSDFVETDVKWISPGNQNRRLDLLPAGRVSDYYTIYSTTPWRLSNDTNNHTLSVYASGSSSDYIEPDEYMNNKYAHLEQTWRFTAAPDSITPINKIHTPGNQIMLTHTFIEVIESGVPTGRFDIVYIYTSMFQMDMRDGNLSSSSDKFNVLHTTQASQFFNTYNTQIRAAYLPNSPDVVGYEFPALSSSDWYFIGNESISRVCYMDDTATMYLSQQAGDRGDTSPVFLFASLNINNDQSDTFYDQSVLIKDVEPNVEQKSIDVLPVGIVYNPPQQISFTSTGIQSMNINDVKLKDSLISFNMSLIDDTGLSILKSDPNEPICPGGDQLYSVDLKLIKHNSNESVIYPTTFDKIELPLDTPGSCSMTIPGISETGSYQLSGTCLIKDKIYMNKQVESYYVANMHTDNIYLFRPGYMDHEYTFNVDHTITHNDFDTRLTTLEQPVLVMYSENDLDDPVSHYFCVGVDSDSAAWIADTDRDLLIKLDRFGNHIDTILVQGHNLDNDEITTVISPKDPMSPYGFVLLPESDKSSGIASISIDSQNNIWVALADSTTPRIVKITENGLHSKPQAVIPITLDGFDPSRLYPSKIETDRLDNVWLSLMYAGSHIANNYEPDTFIIVKYDKDGTRIIDQITFNYPVHIHDIIVDGHNDAWITNSKASTFDNKGSLIHVSESGEILNQIFEYVDPLTNETVVFDKPSQLCLDMYDHLWVVHSGNTLVQFKTGTLDDIPIYTPIHSRTIGPAWDDPIDIINRQGRRHAIEGLSCDTDDRLVVINNVDKKLYISTSNDTSLNIYPGGYSELPIQTPSGSDRYEPDSYEVVQAFGDWTGVRWIQKYFKFSNTIRRISGASNIFSIQSSEEIQKINENIDMSSVIESMSYQSVLSEASSFQSKVMSPILGDVDGDPTEMGKTFYEKIANFSPNNIDIDTCNISPIYSLTSTTNASMKSFKEEPPPTLRRKLDLLSMSHAKLRGSRDNTEESLNNIGYTSTFNIGRNLGALIDPAEYVVRAGVPIVTKELFNDTYRVVVPMTIPDPNDKSNMDAAISEYPLLSYHADWAWSLSFPTGELFTKYYDFYEFKPNFTRDYQSTDSEFIKVQSDYDESMYDQLEGMIDWDNNMTTVSEDISFSDWQTSPSSSINLTIERTIRDGLNIDE